MSQDEIGGVLLNWGNGTPPSVSVPEPASLTLYSAALLGAAARRRQT